MIHEDIDRLAKLRKELEELEAIVGRRKNNHMLYDTESTICLTWWNGRGDEYFHIPKDGITRVEVTLFKQRIKRRLLARYYGVKQNLKDLGGEH